MDLLLMLPVLPFFLVVCVIPWMVRSFQLSLINTGVRNRPSDSLAVDTGPNQPFTNGTMSCAS